MNKALEEELVQKYLAMYRDDAEKLLSTAYDYLVEHPNASAVAIPLHYPPRKTPVGLSIALKAINKEKGYKFGIVCPSPGGVMDDCRLRVYREARMAIWD